MNIERPMTGAERVAKRRAALRAQGLRARTFWLPDTSTDAFKTKAAQASAAIDRTWKDDGLGEWMDAMIDDVLAAYPPPDGLV